MMSRMAGFYIAKVVESAAASPRRAGGRAAPGTTSARGRSGPHRMAAAVHRFIGGLARAGRGRRRLGHLYPPPPAPQSSAQPGGTAG
jgi:hypothetical protein